MSRIQHWGRKPDEIAGIQFFDPRRLNVFARRERVKALQVKGLSRVVIAERLNVSLATIDRDLAALGLHHNGRARREFTPEDDQELLRLSESGMRIEAIARQLGRGRWVCAEHLAILHRRQAKRKDKEPGQ